MIDMGALYTNATVWYAIGGVKIVQRPNGFPEEKAIMLFLSYSEDGETWIPILSRESFSTKDTMWPSSSLRYLRVDAESEPLWFNLGAKISGRIVTEAETAGPDIIRNVRSLTVNVGQVASFAVVASGEAPLAYQWKKSGIAIAGATEARYAIPSASFSDAGSFSVEVSNGKGSTESDAALLTVNPEGSPVIIAHPSSRTMRIGQQREILTVDAMGAPPLAYQWKKDGAPISGAIQREYVITPVSSSSAGRYSAVVTNAVGSAESRTAALIFDSSEYAPIIAKQPPSEVMIYSDDASAPGVGVQACGNPPPWYQWKKDGVPLPGECSAWLTTYHGAGSYSVIVYNSAGTIESDRTNLVTNPYSNYDECVRMCEGDCAWQCRGKYGDIDYGCVADCCSKACWQ